MALPPALIAELDALAGNYPERRAALIPALHRCQEELGWLSPETLEDVAGWVGLEPVEVYGVASFYPMFHLRPVGEHVVSVCHNVCCDLRGAPDIVAQVSKLTGAPPGGTSEDGRYTLKLVECQGACANAPMFDLDGTYHEDLDAERVERILRGVS
jgi:NADH-quinone oxidoreductase subunit E